MTESTFNIGQTISAYTLRGLIDTDGEGRVWRAEDANGTPWALKELPLHTDASFESYQRLFDRLHGLQHANLAAVKELLRPGKALALVAMEHLYGEDMGRALKGGRKLTIEQAVEFLRQALAGLERLHAGGESGSVLMGCISPERIFLQNSGTYKLLTFAGRGSIEDRPGRAQWLSPERLQGFPEDARSDLFSLAATTYALLSGLAPFIGYTPEAVLEAQLKTEREPLTAPCGNAALSALILRALSFRQETRPASALEMLRELKRVEVRKGARAQTTRLPVILPLGPARSGKTLCVADLWFAFKHGDGGLSASIHSPRDEKWLDGLLEPLKMGMDLPLTEDEQPRVIPLTLRRHGRVLGDYALIDYAGRHFDRLAAGEPSPLTEFALADSMLIAALPDSTDETARQAQLESMRRALRNLTQTDTGKHTARKSIILTSTSARPDVKALLREFKKVCTPVVVKVKKSDKPKAKDVFAAALKKLHPPASRQFAFRAMQILLTVLVGFLLHSNLNWQLYRYQRSQLAQLINKPIEQYQPGEITQWVKHSWLPSNIYGYRDKFPEDLFNAHSNAIETSADQYKPIISSLEEIFFNSKDIQFTNNQTALDRRKTILESNPSSYPTARLKDPALYPQSEWRKNMLQLNQAVDEYTQSGHLEKISDLAEAAKLLAGDNFSQPPNFVSYIISYRRDKAFLLVIHPIYRHYDAQFQMQYLKAVEQPEPGVVTAPEAIALFREMHSWEETRTAVVKNFVLDPDGWAEAEKMIAQYLEPYREAEIEPTDEARQWLAGMATLRAGWKQVQAADERRDYAQAEQALEETLQQAVTLPSTALKAAGALKDVYADWRAMKFGERNLGQADARKRLRSDLEDFMRSHRLKNRGSTTLARDIPDLIEFLFGSLKDGATPEEALGAKMMKVPLAWKVALDQIWTQNVIPDAKTLRSEIRELHKGYGHFLKNQEKLNIDMERWRRLEQSCLRFLEFDEARMEHLDDVSAEYFSAQRTMYCRNYIEAYTERMQELRVISGTMRLTGTEWKWRARVLFIQHGDPLEENLEDLEWSAAEAEAAFHTEPLEVDWAQPLTLAMVAEVDDWGPNSFYHGRRTFELRTPLILEMLHDKTYELELLPNDEGIKAVLTFGPRYAGAWLISEDKPLPE